LRPCCDTVHYICHDVSHFATLTESHISGRIVCRTGKLSEGNSTGDVVVTIDGMAVVWKNKFTYQVIPVCLTSVLLLYIFTV